MPIPKSAVTGLLSACLVLVSGCFSAPLMPDVAANESALNRAPNPPLSFRIDCVQGVERFSISCERTRAELSELLNQIGWLSGSRPDNEDPDLIVSIVSPVRRPYTSTPSHNPGAVVLSIAIPFWWSEPAGYRFRVLNTRTGRSGEIDTSRTDTIVMWGLSPLLNLSPNRSMSTDVAREARHIQSQLLGVITQSDGDTT